MKNNLILKKQQTNPKPVYWLNTVFSSGEVSPIFRVECYKSLNSDILQVKLLTKFFPPYILNTAFIYS